MTPATKTWQQLVPKRGALSRLRPGDADVWAERVEFDREPAKHHLQPTPWLRSPRRSWSERELSAQRRLFCPARGGRTRVSDLDFHVVGASSLFVADLPQDIDLYADEVDLFWKKLREGDDFAHWSVWYGCVLFDSGVMREAASFVAQHDAWPEPERKLRQAHGALEFADQMVASGDYGVALEQARGALSLVARWVLLSNDVFPLARDEMPDQVNGLGRAKLARDLRRSIHERPSFDDLSAAIRNAQAVIQEHSAIRRVAA